VTCHDKGFIKLSKLTSEISALLVSANQNHTIELLDHHHGERMDRRTKSETGGINSLMEAVDAQHRSNYTRGQGGIESQRAQVYSPESGATGSLAVTTD
jgi:hypothetical protein